MWWHQRFSDKLEKVDIFMKYRGLFDSKFKAIFIRIKINHLFFLLFRLIILYEFRRLPFSFLWLPIFLLWILYDLLRYHSYSLDKSFHISYEELLCFFKVFINTSRRYLYLFSINRVSHYLWIWFFRLFIHSNIDF